MEKDRQPDPRFSEFTEILDQDGKAIGFKIPDNDFLFEFDSDGGWVDEKGNYFNHDGILQSESEVDEDSLSDRDDDLVDDFEDMLREEEEGIVKETPKEETKKEEEKQPEVPEKKEFDFEGALEKYVKKECIRENLPGELFIYFKQSGKYFEEIKPSVEKIQSVEKKNE